MKNLKLLMGVVGALGILGIAGSAGAVTLSSLVSGGGSVTAGGVVYSNFTDGGNLSASLVNVTFTSTGLAFTANWNTVTPGHDNSTIGYTATASSGTLTNATLGFAGQVTVGSGNTVTVTDTLTDAATQNVYHMNVSFLGAHSGGLNKLTDATAFNPALTSVRVIKSIDVSSISGSFAALNFVDNTFVGAPTGGTPPPAVPEPAALALLPVALIGLGLRKKLSR